MDFIDVSDYNKCRFLDAENLVRINFVKRADKAEWYLVLLLGRQVLGKINAGQGSHVRVKFHRDNRRLIQILKDDNKGYQVKMTKGGVARIQIRWPFFEPKEDELFVHKIEYSIAADSIQFSI